MNVLQTLAALLPLSLSSGINLYATVLVAGLTIHFRLVQNPPAGLEVLGSWPVIIIAAVFYVLEFLADKIQFVDNLWDVIHTFIRPIGAAALAWAALSQADPTVEVLGALAAGSIALVSHSGKAGTRVALNVASPAENVSNIGVSLAEDLFAGALTYLTLKYPLVAGIIALVVLVIIILVVPQLLRWAWFALRSLGAWISSLTNGKKTASDPLPPAHAVLLPAAQPVLLSAIARAQNIKGVGGRSGYMVLTPARLAFTYDARGQARLWELDRGLIQNVRLSHRALLDVVEVGYRDPGGRPRTVRFVFLKDRSPLAEAAALALTGQPAAAAAPAGLPLSTP